MIEHVLSVVGLLALVVLPAVCFVGLFRLIDYLAHDELVARVQGGDLESRSPTDRQPAVTPDSVRSVDSESPDGVTCPHCRTENWEGAAYCWNCLMEL